MKCSDCGNAVKALYFTIEGEALCGPCADKPGPTESLKKPTLKAEGKKFDQNKPDLSLVSLELMEELAFVRMFGSKKYARDNWKKGFKTTRSCAAALRHIFLYLSGQTTDSESGLPHLAHAVACLEHAIYDMRHHPENDDRMQVSDSTDAEGINPETGKRK